ncbi:AAA family ATPase [Arenicella sp. 4NH20-0111]|uniref:DEAD/DEAH box helicase n=1 Tax=Arenicella sp. 4NH20-0111 TaxID=3127648 RepID=UPI003102F8C1
MEHISKIATYIPAVPAPLLCESSFSNTLQTVTLNNRRNNIYKTMSSSFFYLQVEKNQTNASLLDSLEKFSDLQTKQMYVLDRPLGDSKYDYACETGLVLLIPNHKIIFLQLDDFDDSFDDYVDEFIEDLGYISNKYRYKEVLGRPKAWKNSLTTTFKVSELEGDIKSMLDRSEVSSDLLKKQCELLISLLTGSINDIDKVKGDVPDNILDKIKQKIVLFDGDQTRFVYQRTQKKRITIQGLSGTGKTELLLHKLKEIYLSSPDSRIMFTCHNKILADSLRSRIPDFFTFMKVEEQIKWNERLWCVNAWGSRYKPDSGAYTYICNYYDLDFYRYQPGTSFETICKRALTELKAKKDKGFAFDYMLIDESQDFPDSFFELCEEATRHSIYIAGDIFQSIFDDRVIAEIQPDYLLSKCYRTDPKTLMFAHALGMGLFETPKLRWLEDNEWKACGYIVDKNDEHYNLSRIPLRRFEDLQEDGFTSIELVKTEKDLNEDAEIKILHIIQEIQQENPTVGAEDIGVIFIDNARHTYDTADRLEISIPNTFGWNVNKAYETKEKVPDTLFVSNKNNVKGLEFPFVICVTKKITNSRSYRNALYMMLTRSFVRTYLVTSQDSNGELLKPVEEGLSLIKDSGLLKISAPNENEKLEIVTSFNYSEEFSSFYDLVEDVFDELDVLPIYRPNLREVIQKTVGESFDRDEILEVADFNHEKMNREPFG